MRTLNDVELSQVTGGCRRYTPRVCVPKVPKCAPTNGGDNGAINGCTVLKKVCAPVLVERCKPAPVCKPVVMRALNGGCAKRVRVLDAA